LCTHTHIHTHTHTLTNTHTHTYLGSLFALLLRLHFALKRFFIAPASATMCQRCRHGRPCTESAGFDMAASKCGWGAGLGVSELLKKNDQNYQIVYIMYVYTYVCMYIIHKPPPPPPPPPPHTNTYIHCFDLSGAEPMPSRFSPSRFALPSGLSPAALFMSMAPAARGSVVVTSRPLIASRRVWYRASHHMIIHYTRDT
jgi:hypothetical protein